jgi:ATP-dependent protease ClpP protease subunit
MNVVQDKWLSITSQSPKVATIKIHGTIGGGFFEEGVTDEQVEQDLEDIKNLKAETIKVDLSSLGGSVKHGMKIYNLLKSNPANIEIDITGWVASMGTVIAMAGDKIKMVDNNHFLVHEARTYTYGTKSQLESDVKFLDNINNDIAKIYSQRTGISIDEAKTLMAVNGGEGEFWNAEETLSRGFIDETYAPENSRAAANITKKVLNNYKIKAKLKQNKMKINKQSIGEFVNKAYNAVVAGFTDEEKADNKNIEAAIEASTEAVVDELQKNIDAFKEEEAEKLTSMTTERDDYKAKYDKLVAKGSENDGADADLNGDNKTKSKAQLIANDFVSQLSDSDKLLMGLDK